MEDKLQKLFIVKTKANNDGTITAVGSIQRTDRDKDIVKIDGINVKNYKKNPVVLWAHQYSELPIGKALRVWKKDGKLLFKIKWADAEHNPIAPFIAKQYEDGFLNAFSMSFIVDYSTITYDEKKGERTINDGELLEVSGVPVPANADALIMREYRARCEKAWKAGTLNGHDLETIDEAIEKALNVDEKDWLYLVHHMHPNKKNLLSMEDLHHCDMFSQKDTEGDVYTLKHVKISKKNIIHVIDTKDIEDMPETLYDHLDNGFTVKNRTINDTKYIVLAGLSDKKGSKGAEETNRLAKRMAKRMIEMMDEDILLKDPEQFKAQETKVYNMDDEQYETYKDELIQLREDVEHELIEDENIELKTKIAKLELQLKEQEMEEETDEWNNYLTELFDEFNPAGSTNTVADPEQMEDDWVEEALNILEGENNNNG